MAETILVTGGGGFLGKALIGELLTRGYSVCTLNRHHYPELEAMGVRCIRGDLADIAAVCAAAERCQVIMHVAAKAGIWGSYEDFYRTNVLGTQNVIAVCRELGITRLIYTSSPSVAFDGKDQCGVDETAPYPRRFTAGYPATKALAEQRILAANDSQLATVALRPHLIWGPGDQHLLPGIVARARTGRLRLIGKKPKLVDAVYIDNAVAAHLCALDRLKIGATIAGRAYYITNDEPWPTAAIINGFLSAVALPPVHKHVPLGIALSLAFLCESFYRYFRLAGEPPLTTFAALQLGTAHWYRTERAQKELGYRPHISMQEGMERLRRYHATE